MSLTKLALASLVPMFFSHFAMARVIIDFSEPSRVENAYITDQQKEDSQRTSAINMWSPSRQAPVTADTPINRDMSY
jgi:hypothetical protein